MTESQFRALPVEEQNALVALLVPKFAVEVLATDGPPPPRLVNGSWDEFGEIVEALCTAEKAAMVHFWANGTATVDVQRVYVPRVTAPRNLAAAIALLRAKGVIQEDGE